MDIQPHVKLGFMDIKPYVKHGFMDIQSHVKPGFMDSLKQKPKQKCIPGNWNVIELLVSMP